MASKRSIRRAQVHVPDTCALCDNTNDVNWYCNDCKESLCDKCKDIHIRGRKTRNDDIVPIKEANKGGEIVIPEICKIHPGKSCDLYCSKCDVIMCSMCFTQKHKRHAFKHIEEEIDSRKKRMQDKLDCLKTGLGQAGNKLTKRKQDSEYFVNSVESAITEVESQRSELKVEVDSIADSVIEELSALLNEERKSHEQDCRNQEKNIQEMKKLIRTAEQEIKHVSDISSFFELTRRLQTAKSLYEEFTETTVLRPPRFHPGKINKSQLKSMLGNVQMDHGKKGVIRYEKREIDSTHVKHISTFSVSQQRAVSSICCSTDDKHAWISVYGSEDLILVNKDGKVIESVNLDFVPWCLALTNTGGLLMTYGGRGSSLIKNMSEDRRVTKFADISPLWAWGIGVSDNDEVAVSTNSPTILVLNESGDRVRQLSCGGNGHSIVCLTTEHIAVAVFKHEDDVEPELVIKDQSDTTIYTWRGELDNGQMVDWRKFCWMGRDMFVSDHCNNQVYVVSGDSKKATCLLEKRHGITEHSAVSVDRCGHVWIGCDDGTVHVMEL